MKTKALFLANNGEISTDLCSTCDYYKEMPPLVRLEEQSMDKGKPGDLCPRCAKSQLGSLEQWQGHNNVFFPDYLLGLRLFKCRMWYWLVIPGLYDSTPDRLIVPAEMDRLIQS